MGSKQAQVMETVWDCVKGTDRFIPNKRFLLNLPDRSRHLEETYRGMGTDTHTDRVTDSTPELTQRFERKFFVLHKNVDFAYTLLRHICRPDGEYAEGQVNSLYFDTPDLDQYTRSESGEYQKDKFRIRWYGKIKNPQEVVNVFLELKSRKGFTSSKQRQRFQVSARFRTPIKDLQKLDSFFY